MNKAKMIAVCGICGAGAALCLFLAGLVKWIALFSAVIASVCVVIPMLIDSKAVTYSLLVYVASCVVGVLLGSLVNVLYVVPIAAFCMPFTIVKVRGESVKVSAEFKQGEVLEYPFSDERKQVVEVRVKSKTYLPAFMRWILYYALLEAALGLTILSAYLFMKPTFEAMIANKFFFWVLGAAQLIVIPFNFLMQGCLLAVNKIVRKSFKLQ